MMGTYRPRNVLCGIIECVRYNNCSILGAQNMLQYDGDHTSSSCSSLSSVLYQHHVLRLILLFSAWPCDCELRGPSDVAVNVHYNGSESGLGGTASFISGRRACLTSLYVDRATIGVGPNRARLLPAKDIMYVR